MAIRGIIRLAGPTKNRSADLAALSEAMKLATRKNEKVMVLGTLGKIPMLESLALVTPCLDQPDIAEEAGFAAVLIAEKISKDKDKSKHDQLPKVMHKVAQTVKNEKTRDRAKKVRETYLNRGAIRK